MEKNLKKIAWKEAATGGLFLGLILVAIMVLAYFMKSEESGSWIPGFLNFLALVGMIYFYARRMASIRGYEGFSYGQSMGFILRLMLFAGIITGIGQFVLQNYIAPEYYTDLIEQNLANQGFSENQMDLMSESMWVLKNPMIMVISGILSMLIYGGLIGLIVSVFVKRPADPFEGNGEPTEPIEPCNTTIDDNI